MNWVPLFSRLFSLRGEVAWNKGTFALNFATEACFVMSCVGTIVPSIALPYFLHFTDDPRSSQHGASLSGGDVQTNLSSNKHPHQQPLLLGRLGGVVLNNTEPLA